MSRRNRKIETPAKNVRPTSLSFTVGKPEITRDVFLQTFMKNLILAKNKHPEIYQWESE